MGQIIKRGEWINNDADRKTGCPKCGHLSFIRLRNKNGDILGDNVVCGNCKAPYTLNKGEDEDGR